MSARSDTPARSHEFARIDSPVPSQMGMRAGSPLPRPDARPETPRMFSRDRGPPLPARRPPLRSPRRVTDENAGVEPAPSGRVLDDRALLERPVSANILPTTEKLASTGSTEFRPSTTGSTLRRNPTPPATRRCASQEAHGLAPKGASPRTTALRLTPRSRVSPRTPRGDHTPRDHTPRDRDLTPYRSTAATPALVDVLSALTISPRRDRRPRASPEVREVHVTQWMDYTCKYGVGYVLSDGSSGVWFNDSTKVVQPRNGSTFDYITRRLHNQPEQKTTYSASSYPQEIHKKATLLKHFNNYMQTNEKKEGVSTGRSRLHVGAPEPGNPQTYVKKWMRTRHAVLFHLNNKAVQVQFLGDETDLLFSTRSQAVTYVDKRKERHTYALQTVTDVQNQEMSKRLRYVKDMLLNLSERRR